MVTCGEDDFGNVYADVRIQDVGALRGFGSLNWAYEDDLDSSAERQVGDFHAAKELCHDPNRAKCKFGCFDRQEEANSMFVLSNGVSLAQNASEQDRITEVVNSQHGLRDAIGAKDMETDSDDDLRIVLNPLQGVVNECSAEDSEDTEDFVILAGNEAMNNQEWQELACSALDDTVQGLFEGGEKLGTIGDEKAQNGSSPVVQPRICYGSQAYHRYYRYVRGSSHTRVEATVGARKVYSNGKPNRFAGGRGFINYQRLLLPSRRTGAFRGLSCGLEYSIPSNKTVYDVDIDALSEKPWRLPHVDAADYFNFGFDEISWKKYCKELAQFCLELTSQSQIRVYEGGRMGQPMTDATKAGGGSEPWFCANIHGQPIRVSDAIYLIDAKDDGLSQSFNERHSMNSREVNICLQRGNPKSDVDLGIEMGVCKEAQSAAQDVYQMQMRSLGVEPQNCGTGLGHEMQVNESAGICLGRGWTSPSPSRPKTLSPSTPPERLPKQDKRDVQRGKSQSSSVNDGALFSHEEYEPMAFDSRDSAKRRDAVHYVKACERRSLNAALKYLNNSGLRKSLGMKRATCHTISSRLYKTRRLSSHTVNHGTYHSIQVVKSFRRQHISKAAFRACKVCPKGETTRPKKHTIINIGAEPKKNDKPLNDHNITKIAERKVNFVSSRTESKKSNGQGGTDFSQIKDELQGMHHINAGGHISKDKIFCQYMNVLDERKRNFFPLGTERKKSKGQKETYCSQINDQLQGIPSADIGVEVKDKPAGLFADVLNGHHLADRLERKANGFVYGRSESKDAEPQGEIDSSKIKDRLQDIHCEQLKEKLKAKTLKKGRKCKKGTKSKGWAKIERKLMVCSNKGPGTAAADTLDVNCYSGLHSTGKSSNLSTRGFTMIRPQDTQSSAEDLFHERRQVVDATVCETSQEVDHRGGSKFERWTSHNEQARHDSCLSSLEKQNIGGMCLSSKVSAGKVGQWPKQLEEPGCDYRRSGGEECGAQPMAGALKQKVKSSTMFNEAGETNNRKGEQRSCQEHLDQFAAKLEKRRERFNLSAEAFRPLQIPRMENEREPSGRSSIKVLPLADRIVEKLDRPTRKRCWGGG